MLPADGMQSTTAVRYGQSVYGSVAGFNADQLSAMPSVHIGWALLVALVLVEVSRSRWRWLALAYPALTMLAVVVTQTITGSTGSPQRCCSRWRSPYSVWPGLRGFPPG